MEESYQTDPSSSPDYLILDADYDILTVEEILYEISENKSHEDILKFITDLLSKDRKTMCDVRLEIKFYFDELSSLNALDLFRDEYSQLYKIFSSFVLRIKALTELFRVGKDLRKYKFLFNKSLDSFVIIDKDINTDKLKNVYTPICHPGD